MQSLPVPKRTALYAKKIAIAPHSDCVSGISLQFDGISAGQLSSLQYSHRPFEILVVIGGKLSHDVNGITMSDLVAAYFHARFDC